jgi:hypothetical protein
MVDPAGGVFQVREDEPGAADRGGAASGHREGKRDLARRNLGAEPVFWLMTAVGSRKPGI